MAAKIQRKWFSGELNYVSTKEGEVKAINHEGKPFPETMIDTTTIKLDWILQFPRAKEKFDELLTGTLFN